MFGGILTTANLQISEHTNTQKQKLDFAHPFLIIHINFSDQSEITKMGADLKGTLSNSQIFRFYL